MLKNKQYKILTPNGFSDFSHIRKINKDEYFIIFFENNTSIVCSVDHPFIIDNKKIKAKTLKKGQYVNKKDGSKLFIKNIVYKKEKIELYDIMNVEKENIFIVNDIISHNCNFITSGNTVIKSDVILTHKERCSEPLEKLGNEEDLWIWKKPESAHEYLISVDNAEPGGADYSTAQIINLDTLEQVGEYRGNMSLKEFGKMLVDLAIQYNDAFLVIENNSIGLATIQSVLDEEYENLFWTKKGSTEYIDPSDIEALINDKNAKPGFSTTSKTRPLMIERMRQSVTDFEIKINSLRTINEMWTFIYRNGKPTHVDGAHDDLLIALSIGLWVRELLVSKFNLQKEINKQRDKWIVEKTNNKPDGFYTQNKNYQELEIDMGGEKVDVRELYNLRQK